jgi:hypothetical protein
MMFVPHRKHAYWPIEPVTHIHTFSCSSVTLGFSKICSALNEPKNILFCDEVSHILLRHRNRILQHVNRFIMFRTQKPKMSLEINRYQIDVSVGNSPPPITAGYLSFSHKVLDSNYLPHFISFHEFYSNSAYRITRNKRWFYNHKNCSQQIWIINH